MSKFIPSWAMVGKPLNADTVATALSAAGLNFQVLKSPMTADDPVKRIPDKVATYRKDTGAVLGVVGKGYGVVDNLDAFDFADLIDGIEWIRGGYTYTGLNFLVGKLPEVTIAGEKYIPHIVFQNSFNGGWLLKGQVVLVDETNGYTVSVPGKADIKIRHSKRAESRVRLAKAAMATVNEYITSFTQEAGEFGQHLVDEAALEVVVSDLFPIKAGASDKVRDNKLKLREEFMRSYRDPANANWHARAWGLVKAFADFSAKTGAAKGQKSSKKAERVFENTLVGGKTYKRLMSIIEHL